MAEERFTQVRGASVSYIGNTGHIHLDLENGRRAVVRCEIHDVPAAPVAEITDDALDAELGAQVEDTTLSAEDKAFLDADLSPLAEEFDSEGQPLAKDTTLATEEAAHAEAEAAETKEGAIVEQPDAPPSTE